MIADEEETRRAARDPQVIGADPPYKRIVLQYRTVSDWVGAPEETDSDD